jgi:hypothetical protein
MPKMLTWRRARDRIQTRFGGRHKTIYDAGRPGLEMGERDKLLLYNGEASAFLDAAVWENWKFL